MWRESVVMEFEIEDSFKMKIDLIIAKDLQELFGDDAGNWAPVQRHSSIIIPSRLEVKTALPLSLYEIMVNMADIAVDDPYNKLITAIEVLEHGDKQEIMCSTENIRLQKP